MKKTILAAIALMTILSCKKYGEIKSDSDSRLYIYGRLFIQDDINDNGIVKPLQKEITVSLTYTADPTNVLKTTKSNS
ncbi:MAG TPA: hypothetical protein VK796_03410, partial [Cytophaga sp.]|nr:hypothetical protein [Cytophaga sp.]